MDHQVVLCQRSLVSEGKVHAGLVVLLADVVALAVVSSEILDVSVDMELN